MIDRETHESYILVCDICMEEMYFDDFNDAVEYKKSHGWKGRKDDYGWYDVCPDCEEKS